MTDAEMMAALKASGYTVYPPEAMAEDREFVAKIYEAQGLPGMAQSTRSGMEDSRVPSVMSFLRANKGRLS